MNHKQQKYETGDNVLISEEFPPTPGDPIVTPGKNTINEFMQL